MAIEHKDITGSDALHPHDYYQSSDPGAIGPGKSWKDTTTSPPIQKRRNAGDAGWDLILDPNLYALKSIWGTLGDVLYASGASTPAALAGNTTTTKKFLNQTGNGSVSAAPAWAALVAGDIPGLDASKITSGSFGSSVIPNLDASKITTGAFGVARIPTLEPNSYQSHINGGGGLDIWYILGGQNTTSTGTGNPVANTLYAVPFPAPARGGSLDRLAFNVTTLLSGNARVGLYGATSGTNIYPGGLIVDGGGISTGTSGIKTATISQALTAGGLYWAVYLGDAAPTVRRHATGSANAILGIDSALGASPNLGLQVNQTYGALPSNFPAGATTTTSGIVPVVYGRYSA